MTGWRGCWRRWGEGSEGGDWGASFAYADFHGLLSGRGVWFYVDKNG